MEIFHRFKPTGAQAALLALAALLAAPDRATAQEPTDSLRAELARLAAIVDSLSQEVDALRAPGDTAAADPLAALREAATAAAGGDPEPSDEPEEQEFVGRQRSLQALNPEISVNADVMAHLNPDDTDADNFIPREVEISLISALDPYSRAAIFVSRHGPGAEVVPFGGEAHGHAGEEGEEAHGDSFSVEEGYVEWVGLPGGVGFKLGKFQQQLSTLNRWHSHALPFQSRSLPHLAFVGEEALSQTGAALAWLAPIAGGGYGTYELSFEVTRSDNELLWGAASSPTYLGHVNAFWQVGPSVDFELRGSAMSGHFLDDEGSFDRRLYSTEVAFNWIPPARARQRGLTVRAGLMRLSGLEEHQEAGDPASDADAVSGFWSMAEVRVGESWLVGGRLDRATNPLEPEVRQWLVAPTLTWWQSEFVRLRAEYDFLSGVEGGDGSGMFILQVTFAMGPHKHATY
jgi:hypothetical protein